MTDIERQILDTWRIHQRITLFVIEHLPDEALKATLSARGGRDVARQLAHLHNVRVSRLKAFSKKQGTLLIEFDKEVSPDKQTLLNAFRQSGDLMEKYIAWCLAEGGKVPNFKRGVIPMIGYYISHEAHHRGHLLLTIKRCGVKLPDDLRMKIWEWNKI